MGTSQQYGSLPGMPGELQQSPAVGAQSSPTLDSAGAGMSAGTSTLWFCHTAGTG